MAHDHHHGESSRDYFTEQLLTIFVVGLFGFAAIRMYQSDMLKHILVEQFRPPVLIGGIVILLLVVVRAIGVWREAGEMNAIASIGGHSHAGDQDHGPDCNHSHEHENSHVHGVDCNHQHDHGHGNHTHGSEDHAIDDHGHSHDLAWVFAKLLVLFFPVALFFIGAPNRGYSNDWQAKRLGVDQSFAAGELAEVASRGGPTVMSFNDLNDAAYDVGKRESMQGQTASLTGRFRRLADKEFTLFRLRMTCCAADAVPLKVRIVLDKGTLSSINDYDWVRVKGQIQFVQIQNSSPARFIPVIRVPEVDDIGKAKAENEYE